MIYIEYDAEDYGYIFQPEPQGYHLVPEDYDGTIMMIHTGYKPKYVRVWNDNTDFITVLEWWEGFADSTVVISRLMNDQGLLVRGVNDKVEGINFIPFDNGFLLGWVEGLTMNGEYIKYFTT